MTVQWEKVYIFISSTFNDMHAERDMLVKQVFPQLQEWCEKRKLRLIDIDLRWGVTEADATQNRRVVQVCLDRIDKCRPFFLCFLGQRRGWVPGKDDISDETYANYPELAKYAGNASVTEMEILHALVNPLHMGIPHLPTETSERYERARYAFFYLRQPEYLDDLPADVPQLRQVYTNEAIEDLIERQKADEELQHWRKVEVPHTGRPVRAYQAHWRLEEKTPEISLSTHCPSTAQRGSLAWQRSYESWARQWDRAGVHADESGEISDPLEKEKADQYNARLSQGRLGNFSCETKTLAERVIEDLQQAIQDRYPEHVESVNLTPLQRELDQQEQFLQAASEGFIERAGDFDTLDQYLSDDSHQLFVLTAPGGMGKTSLLAHWIDRIKLDLSKGESLHYRFIGASDGSTTVDALLRFVLREIQEIGEKFSEEIPTDPNKMRMEFPNLLESAGRKGKTVIVLDGLNQLESKLGDLAWLPLALPEQVKLVVSFKRGETQAERYYEQLRARGNVILSEVRPFASLDDRKKLVDVYLSQYLKELDPQHIETLISAEGADNPLYLKVVLSELRVFGAFANLGEKIRADFGNDPVSAFQGMLKRLESDPAYSPVQPELLVPRIFAWLAHSRRGLSAEEMSGLLVQEGLLGKGKEGRDNALEAVHGLLRQMRPYLARRDGQVDFFYESFRLAVIARYVRVEELKDTDSEARLAKEWHKALAEYFERQPIVHGRRLYELPYQQTNAALWAELTHTLTDFDFLEAKCAVFSVHELEADYLFALQNWQGDSSHKATLGLIVETLELEAHNLFRDPSLLFQQLYNRLVWMDDPVGLLHPMCVQAGSARKGWLRNVQDPRPAPPPWLHSLEGHTHAVSAVAVTQDRRHLVSASADKTIKVWDLVSGQIIRSLIGHTGKVIALAVTQDGQKVTSGSEDKTVKIWDLPSGRLLRSLSDHAGGVMTVAITPDGQQVIAAGDDRTLVVYDLLSGRRLQSISGHQAKVRALAVTSDGLKVISGAEDGAIKIWDLYGGGLASTIENGACVNGLALTPDGQQLVSGDKDGFVKVWNLANRELIRSYINPNQSIITCVAVTPDGQQIVAGSADNLVKLWNLADEWPVGTMEGHAAEVACIAVTPDGKRVLSGAADAAVKIWDLGTHKELRSLEGPRGTLALAVTPDGQQVISGTKGGTVKVWNFANGSLERVIRGHQKEVLTVAVDPTGRKAVSGSEDGILKVWEIASGKYVNSLIGHRLGVVKAVVTPDGQRVISASRDQTARVWDLASGKVLRIIELRSTLNAAAVSPDGALLVTSSWDQLASGAKDVKVWDLASGQLLNQLECEAEELYALAVTPDGRFVFAGGTGAYTLHQWALPTGKLIRSWGTDSRIALLQLSPDGQNVVGKGTSGVAAVMVTPDGRHLITAGKKIEVWDISNGTRLHFLTEQSSEVLTAVLTPDGQHLLTGAIDETVKIWAPFKTKPVRSLEGHTEFVSSVALTPDGRQVVSGSGDRLVKIWDTSNGQLSGVLEGHDHHVYGVAVTPDGRQVISGSADMKVKIWDLAERQVKHILTGHKNTIFTVAVTPDGKQVVSGSSDDTVMLWNRANGKLAGTLWDTDQQPQPRLMNFGERVIRGVHSLAITPERVIWGTGEGALRTWQKSIQKMNVTLAAHSNNISSLAVTPDGKKIISGSFDRSIKIWDIANLHQMNLLLGHTGLVTGVVSARNGQQVISSSEDMTIRLWDLTSGTDKILYFNDAPIICLAISADQRWLVFGDEPGRVWIFEWIGTEPNFPPRSLSPQVGARNRSEFSTLAAANPQRKPGINPLPARHLAEPTQAGSGRRGQVKMATRPEARVRISWIKMILVWISYFVLFLDLVALPALNVFYHQKVEQVGLIPMLIIAYFILTLAAREEQGLYKKQWALGISLAFSAFWGGNIWLLAQAGYIPGLTPYAAVGLALAASLVIHLGLVFSGVGLPWIRPWK